MGIEVGYEIFDKYVGIEFINWLTQVMNALQASDHVSGLLPDSGSRD